jgi:hypothetical protein
MEFEPRFLSFRVKCLDHTTGDAVENCRVIFGQYKILKLLLKNSSYRGGWKKQIGENIVNVPCALKDMISSS